MKSTVVHRGKITKKTQPYYHISEQDLIHIDPYQLFSDIHPKLLNKRTTAFSTTTATQF